MIHTQPPHSLSAPQSPLSQEAQGPLDLRHYIQIAAKRRWLILSVIVTVTGLTLLQTLTTTSLYRSTSKIQIDPEDANVLPYEELYSVARDLYSTESYLQTQYEVLKSDTLALRTIRHLNLASDPHFNSTLRYGFLIDGASAAVEWIVGIFGSRPESNQDGVLVDRFLSRLEVDPVRGTRLVEVSFISPLPEAAQAIVNTLGEDFIEYNFESKYQATSRATEFLQRQLRDLKVQVERSEEALIGYAQAKNILNINERDNTILQMLMRLNEEMAKVKARFIAETARFESLAGASEENFPLTLKHEGIYLLESRRAELEQKLARLSQQFLPGWPAIEQVRIELEQVRQQLLREKRAALDQARSDYQVTVNHYRQLAAALAEQENVADHLQQNSIQYNILKREVETNKQLYEGLLQRLKEAGVAAGLKSSNIHIVDRGRLPSELYWPRPKLHLFLGLLMGAVLGIGLAFFIEYFDNTVKTPDEIEEHLALPSLGVIPTLDGAITDRDRQLPGMPVSSLLAHFEPRSRMWEAYRSLRTSILLSRSGNPPQKILITSAFAGEGKTTTVANTGIVLAQTGARTIIMDLDMRRSTLASLFGLEVDGGMSTYLSGNSDLTPQIRQTGLANLYLLPAGPQPPNAAELVGSERMDRVFRLLEEEFEHIVIDSPPVLSVTDAQILGAGVDGVVLVIQGGKTPRDAVRKAIQRLAAVGGLVLGAMVNKVDIHRSDYSYYYRYYYDDHYYRHSSQS